MKGDFSKLSYNKKRHYRAVLMQQGRVQTDADFNEQQMINLHLDTDIARSTIGAFGVPKVVDDPEGLDGFAIGLAGAHDLSIGKGRLYIDGILCENDSPTPVTYRSQPDLPTAPLPGTSGEHIVYLDAWDRHITCIEDPDIREIALGGPDTTTRTKSVWQVRLRPAIQWPIVTKPGLLTAELGADPSALSKCQLPPVEGYRGLENQLYRVEIHRGGTLSQATFKWSRDNATIVTAIETISGQKIIVYSTGKDSYLCFRKEQWVEIIDDVAEKTDQHGTLLQIDDVDYATRSITIKSSTPVPVQVASSELRARSFKLRAWDNDGAAAAKDGIALSTASIILENNILVRFGDGATHDGRFSPGDYWLIPGRAATVDGGRDILWPRDPATKASLPQPPQGITHHYAKLASVNFVNGSFTAPVDCRKRFPALTSLTAADVGFDPSHCPSDLAGATTVQEALELLSIRGGGICSVVVDPSWTDWVDRITTAIGTAKTAQICFRAGTYTTNKPLTLTNLDAVRICGAGAATKLIINGSEAAMVVTACASVEITGLSAVANAAGSLHLEHLNGAICLRDCGAVRLDSVAASCGPRIKKEAACIAVVNSTGAAGTTPAFAGKSVYISNCECTTAYNQIGILLVNIDHIRVETSVVRLDDSLASNLFKELRDRREFRALVRKSLVSHIIPGAKLTATPPAVKLSSGRFTVGFFTDTSITGAWESYFEKYPPKDITNERSLTIYLNKAANRILLANAADPVYKLFKPWIAALRKNFIASAAQGIVVGGERAREVRIVDNTISGCVQGIHIGLSRREGAASISTCTVGPLYITGNTIEPRVPSTFVKSCQGIFVGNCDTVFITNNRIASKNFRKGGSAVEGICIHGHLGRVIIVRENCCFSVSRGVYVAVEGAKPSGATQWLAAYNIVTQASAPYTLPEGFKKIENVA